MKANFSLSLLAVLVLLTACRRLDSAAGAAGGFQTDISHEGSTPYGDGRVNPAQRAGMANANMAASRHEATLDVSAAGMSELSRRAAAATAEGPKKPEVSNEEASIVLMPEVNEDEKIADRVRLTLLADPDPARRPLSVEALHNLHVNARNGVVTLSGRVANAEEKRAIEALARNVEGVRALDNQLELMTPPVAP
jgi:osmotically-inducible protein OsmY